MAIRFNHLNLEHGLSQSSVIDIIQDRQGFMWFATQDGLNKYDGYSFEYYKYDPHDHNSVSSNWISKLFESSDGSIWILNDGLNLNRFQPDKNHFDLFRFIGSDSLMKGLGKWAIAEDKLGRFWVGTLGAGLHLFQPELNRFKQIPTSHADLAHDERIYIVKVDSKNRIWISVDGEGTHVIEIDSVAKKVSRSQAVDELLKSAETNNIFEDSWGNIWLSTTSGLARVSADLNSVNDFKSIKKFNENDFRFAPIRQHAPRFLEDMYHNIWILSNSSLERFDSETSTFTSFKFTSILKDEPDLQVNRMFEDSKNNLWFGTYESGMMIFDRQSQRFVSYKHQASNRYSLSNNYISYLFEDKTGTIWVGTEAGGLNYFNLSRLKFEHLTLTAHSKLDANFVWAISPAEKNDIWLGNMSSGLIRYSLDQKKVLRVYEHVTSESIRDIYQDDNNTVWIASSGDGLISFNTKSKRVKYFRHDPNDANSLAGNSVFRIVEDQQGYLWLGTGNGLSRFDKKSNFKNYRGNPHDYESLGNNFVRALHIDERGHVWAGTFFGLYELNPLTDKFNRYLKSLENSNSLSQNIVMSISGNNDGKIYVGTFGGGLNILDISSNTFSLITSRDGLSNDVIYGMQEDEQQRLWLSTNQGLNRIDLKTMEIRHYDMLDGLQHNEFNTGTSAKSASGQLFFGGVNGFNAFFPSQITDLENNSSLVLTGFKTLGDSIKRYENASYLNKIELNYNEAFFTFNFANLDFAHNEKNRYLYKLVGFDENWIETGSNNVATYTNVSPGEYIFTVKSVNNDLVENQNKLEVLLTVHPPFWQTAWFYTLSIVLTLLIVVMVYRWQMQQKIKRVQELEAVRAAESERIRRKTADDFHDEMGNKLTRIRVLCDLIVRKLKGNDSPEVIELLSSISENSKLLFNGTRDFIWSIDPNNDSFYELAIRLKDFGDEFFDNTGIDFHVKGISKILNNVQLSLDKRRQVLLIFKEAMTNCLKHSGAESVTLKFRQQQGHFSITLSDNGNGFNTDQNEGHGLRSIHSRALKVDGMLEINSTIGQGTEVSFMDKDYSKVAV